MGNKVANNAHKVVISGLLLFIGFQLYHFNRPIEYERKFIEKGEQK